MTNDILLVDHISYATLSLNENKGNGALKFQGKFQEGNTINKNKRRYSTNILQRESNRLIETIRARGLIGELDHPTDSIVHFENASHVVTKLWWDNNILMGEAEVLNTPS